MTLEKIEKYIDSKYLNLELSKVSPDLSIQLLLKSLGDILRDVTINKNLTDVQIYNFVRDIIRGISYCIKWIFNSKISASKTEIQENEIEKFIQLGINYGRVANFFVAYHSGYVNYNILENKNTVKFELKNKNKDGFVFRHLDSTLKKSFSTKNDKFFQSLRPLFNEWKNKLEYHEKKVEVPWEYFMDAKNLNLIVNHIKENLYPELPDNYNLKGYTMNDFVLFYSFIYGNNLLNEEKKSKKG